MLHLSYVEMKSGKSRITDDPVHINGRLCILANMHCSDHLPLMVAIVKDGSSEIPQKVCAMLWFKIEWAIQRYIGSMTNSTIQLKIDRRKLSLSIDVLLTTGQ